MDDLSEVLRVVALGGGVFLDAEFTEPFAFVGKAARSLCTGMAISGELICFHYVIDGGFHVSIDGVDEAWVHAGQTVMLPRIRCTCWPAATASSPPAPHISPPMDLGCRSCATAGAGK